MPSAKKSDVEIRKPFEPYDPNRFGKCTSDRCKDGDGNPITLTQQDLVGLTNINHIMARHKQTGLIDHINTAIPTYGDYTQINEFQESLEVVRNAQEQFMQVPADIRREFDNDAGKFFEFVTNPENIDQMVDMGLAEDPAKIRAKALLEEAEARAVADQQVASKAAQSD